MTHCGTVLRVKVPTLFNTLHQAQRLQNTKAQQLPHINGTIVFPSNTAKIIPLHMAHLLLLLYSGHLVQHPLL